MTATDFPFYRALTIAGKESLEKVFNSVYGDSFLAAPISSEWWFDEQAERMQNVFEYGSRPRLDVFESNEYTHWSAWAHTEPDRHIIMIRPPESIDYRLGVLPHEIVHNYAPGLANENHVTQIGNGPMFYHIERSFRYSRH